MNILGNIVSGLGVLMFVIFYISILTEHHFNSFNISLPAIGMILIFGGAFIYKRKDNDPLGVRDEDD